MKVEDVSYSDILKVAESYQKDVCRGIARIDNESMKKLDVDSGDILEIQAKRGTYARCYPLEPSDEEEGIIRIDGLIRNNSGCSIGDTITIRRIDAYSSSKITIKPLEGQDEKIKDIKYLDDVYLRNHLDGMPLWNGDNIAVSYHDDRIMFNVIETIPMHVPIQISSDTNFHIVDYVDLRNTPKKKNMFLDIIKERYALGEINKDVFDKMKKDLEE